MKTNKEFIEGIYQKADEITTEKKVQKKNYIRKITNIAAIAIIAVTIGISFNANRLEEKKTNNTKEENVQAEESVISLKTVGDFANFCNMIKTSDTESRLSYSDDSVQTLESATNSVTDSVTNSKNQSTTNNQVENVDEADIVKISEEHIYYISWKKVVIINAKNGEEAEKIAEIDYSEEKFIPKELYVNDNKLIVIAQQYTSYSTISVDAKYELADRIMSTDETIIIVYDISSKAEPKEIRKIEIDGSYLSSRMIGNNIYFTTTKYIYTSEIKNNDIQALDESIYMPKYKDSLVSQEANCIEYDSIYCFEQLESTSYLMIGGINLESNEEVDVQTFLGAGNYIYSSEKNMYIAKSNTQYNENYEFVSGSTHILKFSLNEGKVEFQAEAEIDGRVNNQFSMDENGEYFRIATTVGDYWEMTEETSNSLYVLNSKLELVGKVEGFGKEERIYSVRYDNNKAYVVTFKQTDPLFVIDLSDPTNPQILGELKIPGYSTYLHPYDETHIIGFGYETKEEGTRVTTDGLKMVMFDISDLRNPKVLFKVEIGDKYTSSPLTYNHKALLYSKEKNIIAFPVNKYSGSRPERTALIYEIDLEKGFTLKGKIVNAYTQSVERIVYVNNTYYTLSQKVIKVANMDTLQVIKEIEI